MVRITKKEYSAIVAEHKQGIDNGIKVTRRQAKSGAWAYYRVY